MQLHPWLGPLHPSLNHLVELLYRGQSNPSELSSHSSALTTAQALSLVLGSAKTVMTTWKYQRQEGWR